MIINEQKTAKVIQLLEELRRDMPQVPDRVDPEAAAMALPADPEVMLEVIKETQEIALPPADPQADDDEAVASSGPVES